MNQLPPGAPIDTAPDAAALSSSSNANESSTPNRTSQDASRAGSLNPLPQRVASASAQRPQTSSVKEHEEEDLCSPQPSSVQIGGPENDSVGGFDPPPDATIMTPPPERASFETKEDEREGSHTTTATLVPPLAASQSSHDHNGAFADAGQMVDSREHSIDDAQFNGPPQLIDDLPPPLTRSGTQVQVEGEEGENDGGNDTAQDKKKADAIGADLGLSYSQLLNLVDAPSSLFVFGSKSKIRHAALKISRHTYFKNVVLALIIINSILLAMDQPAVKNPKELDTFLGVMEYVFTIAFDLECLIKIVAMGFVAHEGSYLRSGWNCLDFIIVCTSTIQLFGVGQNYSALRVFRVLRPLRSVSRVKKLKHLIGGLFRALPVVFDNMLLMLFVLIVFAIAAVQLWMNKLSQRCYITEWGEESPVAAASAMRLAYKNMSYTTPTLVTNITEPCGGTFSCPVDMLYNTTIHCGFHRELSRRKNMNYDNIATSFLLTLKIMVLDNWPDDLSDAMNASNGTEAAIFFILLTLIGSFYCVNLFLAILTEGYTASSSRALHEEKKKQKDKHEPQVSRLKDACEQVDLDDPQEQQLMNQVAEMFYDDMLENARQAKLAAEKSGAIFTTQHPPRRKSKQGRHRNSAGLTQQQLDDRRMSDTASVTDSSNGGNMSPHLRSQDGASPDFRSNDDEMTDASPPQDDEAPFGVFSHQEGSGGSQRDVLPLPHRKQGATHDQQCKDHNSNPLEVPRGLETLVRGATIQGQRHQLEREDSDQQHSELLAPTDSAVSLHNELLGSGSMVYLSGKEVDGVPIEYFYLPDYREIFTDDLDYAAAACEARVRARKEALGEAEDEEGEGKEQEDGEDPESANLSRASSLWSASDSSSIASSVFYAETEEDERHPARIKIGKLVNKKAVEYFMVVVTVINVIALSIDHHGIGDDLSFGLDIISIVCTVFFFIEISAKLFAFGWTKTMSKGFNVLDFVLVVVAIPDIALSGGKASGFSAFRVFRLLRVLRLMKEVESLQAVIQSVVHSVSSVTYLSLLILLFLYVFAIMGMQLFGTSFGNKEGTRDSFGTLWQALLVCFIVVTGEDWTDRMVIAMQDEGREGEVTAVIYFVMCFMIGNYILINLFVAIILDKLAEKMEQIAEGSHLTAPLLVLPPVRTLRRDGSTSLSLSAQGSLRLSGTPQSPAMGSGFNIKQDTSQEIELGADAEEVEDTSAVFDRPTKSVRWEDDSQAGSPTGGDDAASLKATGRQQTTSSSQKETFSISAGSPRSGGSGNPLLNRSNTNTNSMIEIMPKSSSSKVSPQNSKNDFESEASKTVLAVNLRERKFIDEIQTESEGCVPRMRQLTNWLSEVVEMPVEGKALNILSPENPLRRALLNIVGARAFTLLIDVLLFANVIFLCFESPLLGNTGQKTLDVADYFFTIVFAVEMAIKILAWGAVYPAGERSPKLAIEDGESEWIVYPAYFRDPWNCCDAVVTITSIIGLGVPVFRVFRSLRTIRLIVRNESMRIIVVALLQALPNILNGILLGLFVFVVFGIMGVQFFKGEYYKCNDPNILPQSECVGSYNVTVDGALEELNTTVTKERHWERLPYHFDHLGASILALFVVAVGDGWSAIMYNGMDTTHVGGGLVQDNQPWMSIFFILAFICTNFFAFNMIIGILINYFSKMKKVNDGSMLMSPEQRMYIKAQSAIEQAMFADDQVAADNALSKKLDKMLTYRVSCGGKKTRLPLSEFIVLFVVLVNVAFIAATHSTMSDEVADMIEYVSLACLILFTIEFAIKLTAYFPVQYFTQAWNIFDFIIIFVGWIEVGVPGIPGISFLRVLRVSKLLRGSGVQKLLQKTIMSFNSFVNVIAVLILTFFIFAVAGVNLFGKVKFNGAINHNNNFQTVPNSMLLLYQIVTTEGWSDVMTACSIQEPKCDASKDECGNQTAATIFFCLYMVLGAFTVLQLFVAVIVEIFTETSEGIDDVILLFIEMKAAWVERFGNRKIVDYKEFIEMIPYIPKDLVELPAKYRKGDIIRLVSVLSLPIDSKFRVTYKDVVYSLAWKKYNIEVRTLATVVQKSILSKMSKTFEVSQVWCTEIIQEKFREHMRRKRGLPLREPLTGVEIIREYENRVRKISGIDGSAGGEEENPSANATRENSTLLSPTQSGPINFNGQPAGYVITAASPPPAEATTEKSRPSFVSEDSVMTTSTSPTNGPTRGDSLQLPSLKRKETVSSDGGLTQQSSGAYASSDGNSSQNTHNMSATHGTYQLAVPALTSTTSKPTTPQDHDVSEGTNKPPLPPHYSATNDDDATTTTTRHNHSGSPTSDSNVTPKSQASNARVEKEDDMMVESLRKD